MVCSTKYPACRGIICRQLPFAIARQRGLETLWIWYMICSKPTFWTISYNENSWCCHTCHQSTSSAQLRSAGPSPLPPPLTFLPTPLSSLPQVPSWHLTCCVTRDFPCIPCLWKLSTQFARYTAVETDVNQLTQTAKKNWTRNATGTNFTKNVNLLAQKNALNSGTQYEQIALWPHKRVYSSGVL